MSELCGEFPCFKLINNITLIVFSKDDWAEQAKEDIKYSPNYNLIVFYKNALKQLSERGRYSFRDLFNMNDWINPFHISYLSK